MRLFLPLLAALFFSFSTIAQVKKITAESTIQNVTVFTSGARIERTSSVSLGAGRTEIVFQGLSNQLDQQSVQLKANENITLLSVNATKDFVSQRKVEDDEKKFIENTSSLRDKLDFDRKLLEVFKNEENMIIKNEAIGGQAGVKTVELKEALDLHRQRLTEVYQKQLEIQKRIAQQEKELAVFNAQLAEISKKRDSINYIVTALIESKSPSNVKFQLLYNIKDAGWYPTYDVRVQQVSQPLNVLMNANIFQRSGETWKNVTLQLSTGNPNENATPSPLEPWRLGYYNPSSSLRNQVMQGVASGRVTNQNGEPISGASVIINGSNTGVITDVNGFFKFNSFPANSEIMVSSVGYESKSVALISGYTNITLEQSKNELEEVIVTGLSGRVAGLKVQNTNSLKKNKEEKAIQTIEVATEYQPTTLVYRIEDKYTIETDGKTTTIGIKNMEVAAQYEYFTSPKTDPSAFLTAKIADWQDYDFQSGEASLYFEGTYLGKTYINLGETSDTLSLSLGKDNGVKVTRKIVKEFSTKRFIGSNQTDSRQYEITVRNTKKEPVHIIVTDQFPISIVKEISVNDVKAPEANLDENTGITTWDFNLAPGQEKKLIISYSVKYPKGRRVVLE